MRNDSRLKKQIEKANLLVSANPVRTFLANAVLFLAVLFLLGIFVRTDSFAVNLLRLSRFFRGDRGKYRELSRKARMDSLAKTLDFVSRW